LAKNSRTLRDQHVVDCDDAGGIPLDFEEAAGLGIAHLWLQPGAESREVLARARELGLEPIAGGPCVLVVLGYRDE